MAQFGPQGENTQLTVLTTDYPVTPVDLAADQSGTWLLVGQSAEAALALQVSAQFGLTGSLRFPAVQEHLVFSQP